MNMTDMIQVTLCTYVPMTSNMICHCDKESVGSTSRLFVSTRHMPADTWADRSSRSPPPVPVPDPVGAGVTLDGVD